MSFEANGSLKETTCLIYSDESRSVRMRISYKKLWKMLIDKNMKKETFRKRPESVLLLLPNLAKAKT